MASRSKGITPSFWFIPLIYSTPSIERRRSTVYYKDYGGAAKRLRCFAKKIREKDGIPNFINGHALVGRAWNGKSLPWERCPRCAMPF
jgi:hypothetical protein